MGERTDKERNGRYARCALSLSLPYLPHTHTHPSGKYQPGSTAQNLAHVASGKLDCYFDEGGFGGPWDVAAGIVSLLSSLFVGSLFCGVPITLLRLQAHP